MHPHGSPGDPAGTSAEAARPSADARPGASASPAPTLIPAPAPAPAPLPPLDRRTVLAAGLPAVAGLLGLAALTGPRPASLGDPVGDLELAAALAPHLGGHRRVAAALLDGGEVRFAGFGADETAEFEIGSVSKTFAGALLAEAVDRGEVALDTTVADVLGTEADGSEIADVTLAELATHTSGLPRLALTSLPGSAVANFLRKDPYAGRDAEQVVQEALGGSPSGRGEVAYSNLGVALQGQLLARAAGTEYAALLTSRVLEPLQLGGTYAPILTENLRGSATRGRGKSGLPHAAWTMNGSAPAGGIRSTAGDLATYLSAVRDGSAPGAAAAGEILHEVDATERIGMNWFHEDVGDGSWQVFHNGMTGGFASYVGFTPQAGQGIVLLTDTARSLDALAVDVLRGEVAP